MYKKLLEPITIGNMTLKNRIMFPPMTTGYEARDGSITPQSLAFYERLAKGGTAYIVMGDVAPVRTASPTPMLYDDAQIPSFQKLADALHAHDTKLALQIFHPEYDVPGVGRMIGQAMGLRQAAAKAEGEEKARITEQAEKVTREAYAKLHHDMQHFVSEATIEQLTDIKEKIAAAAARAQKAGVDAIEVHGDRLLGSLCSKQLNHREDEYGGSLENRTRYALEVVKAIQEAAPELVVEYKLPIVTLNADGSLRGKGGLQEDEAVQFARMLEEAGVDMIQAAQANHTGNMKDTIPPMGEVEMMWTLEPTKKIKEAVSIPVAAVGRMISLENGEQLLSEGHADVIGYGRSLLADPDLGRKAESGEPVRACMNCNKGCVDAIQNRRFLSCVLNAENGHEGDSGIIPAETKKKVAIVGGGIAGLEAARVAAIKGHDVTLFEASGRLGGQLNIASVPPRKGEILRSVQFFEEELPRLGVNLQLHTKAQAKDLNDFDAVIAAVGAHNMDLPFPCSNSNVLSSWDVLAGKEATGHCAVLGGGLVGTETAEYLANKGLKVTIIEMLDKIANGESSTVLPLIQKDFADHKVVQMPNTKVLKIEDNCIYALNTTDQTEGVIHADTIINAMGSKKNTWDSGDLNCTVLYVGDCAQEKTADIASAIRTGYYAANSL